MADDQSTKPPLSPEEWDRRASHGTLTDRDILNQPAAIVSPLAPYAVHRTLNESATAIQKAIAEGYRIERCRVCGGPKVFSKLHPIARCFRCGTAERLRTVASHEGERSWRRCALCGEQAMAGLPLSHRYCRDCGKLSSAERTKRLRWKEEQKQAGTVNSSLDLGNKIKGASISAATDQPVRRSETGKSIESALKPIATRKPSDDPEQE